MINVSYIKFHQIDAEIGSLKIFGKENNIPALLMRYFHIKGMNEVSAKKYFRL